GHLGNILARTHMLAFIFCHKSKKLRPNNTRPSPVANPNLNSGESIRLPTISRYDIFSVFMQDIVNEGVDRLSDFRTDKRVLVLSALAIPVGIISAAIAKALLWLIAVVTNISFFHRFSASASVPQDHHLGLWV